MADSKRGAKAAASAHDAREEMRSCSICRERFTARRASNGRWPRTCGPFCQAAALDRLIDALLERRRALLEGGTARELR